MRRLVLTVAACAIVRLRISSAFTCPSSSSASLSFFPIVSRRVPTSTTTRTHQSPSSRPSIDNFHEDDGLHHLSTREILITNNNSIMGDHTKSIGNDNEDKDRLKRIRTLGKTVWERMDTLNAAGLYNLNNTNDSCNCNYNERDVISPVLHSGFKTNVGLLIGAFMFKWYRARFINKIPVWDRQPQWNMVITSPEQEKELHAYSCKTCGSTIFIARHREWFFKGGNTECTNCGAKGTDNFVEIRNDILNSIDDDYFDYESPLDFVSAAERRKLVKQAGGDEELAKKLAIDNVMKNDKEQFIVGNDNPSSSSSSSDEPIKKKKKKKKTKKREEEGEEEVVEESVVATKSKMDQVKLKKEPVDVFDELDML